MRDCNQKHRKIYDTRFGDGYSPKTVRHKHHNDLVFRIDVFLDVEKDAKISVAISQFFSFQLLGQNYNMLSGLVGLPFYHISPMLFLIVLCLSSLSVNRQLLNRFKTKRLAVKATQ